MYETRVTTSLSMQDVIILLDGVERYAKAYPTTEINKYTYKKRYYSKAVTRVKNILDQAFNTILENDKKAIQKIT
jgi:hypothetical protein